MFERFYKLSALGRAEDTAALQDFDPADVSYGSFTTDAVEATRACMSAVARSLIPGFGVKLSAIILAGPTVLSAVGACPPHDGVRRRWWINVASAVSLIESSQKIGRSHHRHRPGRDIFSRRTAGILWSRYCSLRGNLLLRPVELGSVDPHAVQNDRQLARDGDCGLSEPIALGEPHAPSL
jgi:hypothetical protein